MSDNKDVGRWASDVIKREPETELFFCSKCELYQDFKKTRSGWVCVVCGHYLSDKTIERSKDERILREQLAEDRAEDEENSEGDGLMSEGDIMFPPEFNEGDDEDNE
jgi:hypothetical protein